MFKSVTSLALSVKAEYDILILQEVWINLHIKALYYSKITKYWVVYDNNKAAIYIYKQFDITALEKASRPD